MQEAIKQVKANSSRDVPGLRMIPHRTPVADVERIKKLVRNKSLGPDGIRNLKKAIRGLVPWALMERLNKAEDRLFPKTVVTTERSMKFPAEARIIRLSDTLRRGIIEAVGKAVKGLNDPKKNSRKKRGTQKKEA